MRKWAAAIVFGGLFLLMLSALVVTPEDALPPSPPPPPRHYHAVFMPPAEPAAQVSAGIDAQRIQPGLMVSDCADDLPSGWHTPGVHDSNGRVISAARYENSVYEVFRAETAGG